MSDPVCVVVGFGPGNGEAFARRFSREGYRVAMLSRSTEHSEPLAAELGDARAYACDVTDADAIAETFAAIAADLGPVDTLLYNAGSGVFGSVDDVSPEAFETAWRVNAMGLFLAARQVIEPMREAGRGNIIITGATASLRGGARFAAFASAKAAQRNLAQSMARHLWPEGVHVALIIVDGMIDSDRARKMAGDRPDESFMSPDDIAETVYRLAVQPRSAWSFEVDLRPHVERW